jgi:hypothetical protein
MSEPRCFFAQVSDPTGHVSTECVSVEELGRGELYRFVLDDGTDWMVDGRELRTALEPEARAA